MDGDGILDSVKSKSDLVLNGNKQLSSKSLQDLTTMSVMNPLMKDSITVDEIVPSVSKFFEEPKKDESWKLNLSNFTSQKRGLRAEDKKLSKGIRRFYKEQDLLISTFEHIKENKLKAETTETPVAKKATRLGKISFACNLVLLAGKVVAAALSGSLAVMTSVIDSVVDLVSGALMWWSSRAIRKRDPYLYPQGRTRLEPVAIVVLSVVMALASVAMIQQSVETMVEYVKYDLQTDSMHLPNHTYCVTIEEMYEYVHLKGAHGPTFEWDSISICLFTVVLKLILFLMCRRCTAPAAQALAQDHRNDVVSNTGALACGVIGYRLWKYADPLGAILISVYIILSWYHTGKEQIKLLTGHTAQPDFLKMLTWTAVNHDSRIKYIDTLRAFHFGNNFLVEVDIVLPGLMKVFEAHDIGESLQMRLERMSQIERAFVHIDYEVEHRPSDEHKHV